jgi:hypothetical protein
MVPQRLRLNRGYSVKRHSTQAILLFLIIFLSAHALTISAQGNSGTTQNTASVVVGEVKQIDSKMESGLITSYVTIFIIEVKNGSDSLNGKEVTVKCIGGEIGDVILWQSDQPSFHVGEIVEVHLRQQGSFFTVSNGLDGKVSLDTSLQPITAATAAGYKLYWYKPGVGANEATTRPGPDWYGPLRWDNADMPANFWVDPRNMPSGITESSFTEFVRRSYQTWQDDPTSYIMFAYMGTRTDREWGVNDGANIFCWRYIDGNGGTLGVTRSYFGYIPGNYDSLRLVDADIELDTGDSWSATETPPSDRIDVQTVGTHEVGHVVGLADLYDSEDAGMTMFGYTSPGDTRQRTLEWGDQAGLHVLYPSGVTNAPPTAYIDSITPNPATQGQTVSFSGHGTDIDGSIIAYEWRSSVDGALSSSPSFTISSLSVGVHTIYFRVQDDNNQWSTEDTRTITINPSASIFDFSLSNSGGITVVQGGSGSNTITINLVSGTSQAVTLSASGLPSGTSASFNPPSGNPTFASSLTVSTSSSTASGSYTITVIGSGNGLTRTTQFTLTIDVSGPGTITVYSLPFSYLGQDPEPIKSNDLDASIKVDYTSGGQSQSNTHNTYFSISADVGSTITITVASAPAGWSFANKWDWYGHMQYDGASLTFQVPLGSTKIAAFFNSVNQMPTAHIDSISPNPATQGQLVTFTGHGTDMDGTITAYNWRSTIDGELGTSSTISTSTLSVGTHTIYFEVQDNVEAWSTEDSMTLTVNPSQPSSMFRVYSLAISYLGQDPESVKSNDLTASIRVDYVYQGQIQSKTGNTYFDVTADEGSNITFTVVSSPSDWLFANKWDYYGHTQYDQTTLTVTVSPGLNKVAAYYTPSTSQIAVSLQASSSTVDTRQGGHVSVTVSTFPPTQGLDVGLEVSQDNQQWSTWATGKTGSDGKFTTSLSFTIQGVYQVRARWNGGTTESITITAVLSPCIIATVAYGGPKAPEVVHMRHVRDDLIGSSELGKTLVRGWNSFYYSWSPTLAELAAKSNSLRLILRLALAPLGGIIDVTADSFKILAPLDPDLASLMAFFVAADLSISFYIVAPAMVAVLTVRCIKRKISHEV